MELQVGGQPSQMPRIGSAVLISREWTHEYLEGETFILGVDVYFDTSPVVLPATFVDEDNPIWLHHWGGP